MIHLIDNFLQNQQAEQGWSSFDSGSTSTVPIIQYALKYPAILSYNTDIDNLTEAYGTY